MSHALETSPITGEHAFVAAREEAWHRLGDYEADRLLTVAEAVQRAHLADWNVRTVPVLALLNPGVKYGPEFMPVPGKAATIRDNPWTGETEPITTVSDGYQPIQNEFMADFMARLIGQTGTGDECVSAAGSILGGRRAFVTMAFPEEITVGGQDAHNLWLSGITSHDGSMAMTTIAGMTRVVCKNTADWALAGADPKHKVRHSAGAAAKVAEAQQALGIAYAYAEAYAKEMEDLLGQQMTDREFEAMIAANFVAPTEADDTLRVANRKDRDRDVLTFLWKKSETTETGRGTRYAALNAVTEWAEWGRPGDLSTDRAAVSNLFGKAADLRAKAYQVLV